MTAIEVIEPLVEDVKISKLVKCITAPKPGLSRHFMTFTNCTGQPSAHVYAGKVLRKALLAAGLTPEGGPVYLRLIRQKKHRGPYQLVAQYVNGQSRRCLIAELDEDETWAWLSTFTPAASPLPPRNWEDTL